MFNGSNCDRKSQLSGILPEPLNPRGLKPGELKFSPTLNQSYQWSVSPEIPESTT